MLGLLCLILQSSWSLDPASALLEMALGASLSAIFRALLSPATLDLFTSLFQPPDESPSMPVFFPLVHSLTSLRVLFKKQV